MNTERRMEMTHPKCEDCRFWDTSVVSEDGAASPCRKLPPIADDRDHSARWPMTEETDWCGSFERDPNRVEELDEPLAATPPDGAAEREAGVPMRGDQAAPIVRRFLQSMEAIQHIRPPEGAVTLRATRNELQSALIDALVTPTPAPGEAPGEALAAGTKTVQDAFLDAQNEHCPSEGRLHESLRWVWFARGWEAHAALAARPAAAVTEAMVEAGLSAFTSEIPPHAIKWWRVRMRDALTAALAARGPA